jgi:hypothetical protein
MLRGEKTYWICQNRDCGITAICDAAECATERHTCRCGSLMVKKAQETAYSYLNFLREAESSETEELKAKEETPCEG